MIRTLNGGNRLDGFLAKLARKVVGGKVVDVGFLAGRTYPDGTSVPTIAAIQEFGNPSQNIPPRPFFRTMVAAKGPNWAKQTTAVLKANGYDAEKALDAMGAGIKGQLQQSIKDTNAPPLAAATIARKGFAKPLIDTGVMFNAVDYLVHK